MQGARHILKLSTPFDKVSGRQRDAFRYLLLKLSDKSSPIAVLHINANYNPALRHVSINLRGTFYDLDGRQIAKCDFRPVGGCQKNTFDVFDIVPEGFR